MKQNYDYNGIRIEFSYNSEDIQVKEAEIWFRNNILATPYSKELSDGGAVLEISRVKELVTPKKAVNKLPYYSLYHNFRVFGIEDKTFYLDEKDMLFEIDKRRNRIRIEFKEGDKFPHWEISYIINIFAVDDAVSKGMVLFNGFALRYSEKVLLLIGNSEWTKSHCLWHLLSKGAELISGGFFLADESHIQNLPIRKDSLKIYGDQKLHHMKHIDFFQRFIGKDIEDVKIDKIIFFDEWMDRPSECSKISLDEMKNMILKSNDENRYLFFDNPVRMKENLGKILKVAELHHFITGYGEEDINRKLLMLL